MKDLNQELLLRKVELAAVRGDLLIKLNNAIKRNKENPSEKLATLIDELNTSIRYLESAYDSMVFVDQEIKRLNKQLFNYDLEVQKLTKERDNLKKIANNIEEKI